MKRDAMTLQVTPGVADRSRSSAWQGALAALALAIAWIVGWYAATGATMVATWAHTETYAHGFVVAPISLWLIWRMRERLRAMTPRPSWTAVPLLAVAGFGWLLGQFGTVNVLAQVAFVAMLVLAVPALLGWAVTRALMFPLGFLFFSVPVGDFLLPTLMDRTADFTVAALRASGVPVYREGLLLAIPSGRWSIVEACSGVRYLIASLMVGTLFGYLNYRTLWRRWVFVGVAIVVPIVANWLRAYMIVLLGHLSNNRIATGVDHLIYGWVFFGIVMLLMFWVGARWAEKAAPQAAAARPGSVDASAVPASPARVWAALAAVMAVTLVAPLVERAQQHERGDAPLALAPLDVPGWERVANEPFGYAPVYRAPNATLRETLRRGDAVVGLYVAYYRGQDPERKLVSSENVLVRSEDPTWRSVAAGTRRAPLGTAEQTVAYAQLRGPGERRLTAWQWYWIDGTLTSSDAVAKALTAWARLCGRGDASASVVVYAADAADPGLQAFTRDAWPAIAAALRRVGNMNVAADSPRPNPLPAGERAPSGSEAGEGRQPPQAQGGQRP